MSELENDLFVGQNMSLF